MVVTRMFQWVLSKNFCHGLFHGAWLSLGRKLSKHFGHCVFRKNTFMLRANGLGSSTLALKPPRWFALTGLLLLTLGPLAAHATDSSDGFFYHLENDSFQVLDKESCERDYKKARRAEEDASDRLKDVITEEFPLGKEENNSMGLFAWSPTGTRKRAVRPACSADALESLVLNSRPSTTNQANGIRNYFKACGDELLFDAPPTWLGLMHLTNTRYEYCKHPRIRKVVIHMPDGNIVRGMLAMKPGEVARPLVIIKCGVFCNTGETSHRFQVMHLFDEGPFNVLAIGNVTGAEYIVDNEHLGVGGFDEGMQLIRLAKLIEQLPLAKYVSSLHFSGVSLGAQGGFFASYLNRHNLSATQHAPHFKSFLAMCPVVELQPSITSFFGDSMKGKIARRIFFNQLIDIISHVPVLGRYFPDFEQIPTNQIPDHVAEGAVDHYKSVSGDWALPPFTGHRIGDKEALWHANSFIHLADTKLDTPTLAFAGEDDWVVPTQENAVALALRVGSQPNNNLQVVTVPHGNHCAFGTLYGWDVASAIVRNFVISHSPELVRNRHMQSVAIRPERISFRLRPGETEKHISQDYEAQTGRNFIRVTFKIWDTYEKEGACFTANMYQGDPKCIRNEEIRIPLSDINASWARVPNTGIEAEVLTRWLNANLRMVDKYGKLLQEGSMEPARLRWYSYESSLNLPGWPSRPGYASAGK